MITTCPTENQIPLKSSEFLDGCSRFPGGAEAAASMWRMLRFKMAAGRNVQRIQTRTPSGHRTLELLVGGMRTNQGRLTHVEVGDVLSIQGLVDGQLSRYGVDDEDPGGGLVGPRAGHAVAEGAGLVVVRADLRGWKLVDSYWLSG